MSPTKFLPQSASDQRAQVVLSMSEKDFQADVVRMAKILGHLTYHTYDSRRSEPGFPDLVMIHQLRGTIMVRELKTEKGKASAPQQKWLAGFSLVGISSGVWRPSGLLDGSILAELKGETRAGSR